MRSSDAAAAVDIAFDDPNLIADAGLIPVLALACGASRAIILRADWKFYTAGVVAAARRAGAHVSLTTGSKPSVDAAIAECTGQWPPIHYPNAFVDADADLIAGTRIRKLVARQ